MGYGKGIGSYFPELTYQCSSQVEAFVDDHPAGCIIVDIGAGGRRLRDDIITFDFDIDPETKIAGDAQLLPLADNSIDAIICTGLIEHLEDEVAFIREALRILKPGGRIHVEVPFLQQYHEAPVDHRRFTVSGLSLFLTQHGFEVDKEGFHIGPSVTIATLNAYYASLLFEGDNVISKVLSNAAFMIAACFGWALKFLDKFLMHKKSAHRLAFGVYSTAHKPAA